MVCVLHTYSESDNALLRYGRLKFSKMAAGRHLEFDPTGNGAVRSAVPENPTLEPNMKEITKSRFPLKPFSEGANLTTAESLLTGERIECNVL